MVQDLGALVNQLVDILTFVGTKTAIVAIVLAVGWGLGRILGSVVGRTVSRLGGDAVFRRTVVGRALIRSGFTASEFSKVLSKWVIYIIALLVALESLGVPAISQRVEASLATLPTLVGALVILVLGLTFSDWMGEFIKKGFTTEQKQVFYINLIGDLFKAFLYFVTIDITLSLLGIDVTVLNMFAQALAWAIAIFIAVVSGIVIGWALKDKVKDLLQ